MQQEPKRKGERKERGKDREKGGEREGDGLKTLINIYIYQTDGMKHVGNRPVIACSKLMG